MIHLTPTITPAIIERYIKMGAAPGCQVALSAAGRDESFALGVFGAAHSGSVSTDTPYDIASITKLFTTALVLRLHEQGVISLDDLCAKYLDNFQNSEIRIIDLVTHRVDFGVALPEYRAQFPDDTDLERALLQVVPPRNAAPVINYANLQFIYLGKIVEIQTGRDLQHNMHQLFNDLGLEHTCTGIDILARGLSTPPTEVLNDEVISGMTHDETARMFGGLAGHAGLFSTAKDLIRFGKAWFDGSIVQSKELRDRVFSNHDTSGLSPQGIGWWLRYNGPTGEQATPGVYSQNGFTGPMLIINPSLERVTAFTCNRTYYGRDNKIQREVWRLLVDWASGKS